MVYRIYIDITFPGLAHVCANSKEEAAQKLQAYINREPGAEAPAVDYDYDIDGATLVQTDEPEEVI